VLPKRRGTIAVSPCATGVGHHSPLNFFGGDTSAGAARDCRKSTSRGERHPTPVPQRGANSIEPSLGGGETGAGTGVGVGTTSGAGTELWVGGSGGGSGMEGGGSERRAARAGAFCWCRWVGALCLRLALRRDLCAGGRGFGASPLTLRSLRGFAAASIRGSPTSAGNGGGAGGFRRLGTARNASSTAATPRSVSPA
jgi:hypothetical protein